MIQARRFIYVDPGINGTFKQRPTDGSKEVFRARRPCWCRTSFKASSTAFAVGAGVVWGHDLGGAGTVGIPSLAFAVGVYLAAFPLPSPLHGRRDGALAGGPRPTPATEPFASECGGALTAESDSSPGVLLASGYIAGGAIAGIVIAFMAGVWSAADTALTHWAETHNPFYGGPNADGLALIPFVALTVLLYGSGAVGQIQRPPLNYCLGRWPIRAW